MTTRNLLLLMPRTCRKHGVVTVLKNNTKHLYNVDIVGSLTRYNKENALFSVTCTVLE
jgi:hypothetical protein